MEVTLQRYLVHFNSICERCYFLCLFSLLSGTNFAFFVSSEELPLLRGDPRPGFMPDIPKPLGTSYWKPLECIRSSSHDVQLETNKFQGRHLLGYKYKKRPSGWEKRTLQLGEKILDASFQLLNNTIELNYCPFLTQECCEVENSVVTVKRKPRLDFQQKFAMSKSMRCDALPKIKRGDLGSCAFVAQGSTLLRVPSGEDIDRHSTVIRLGHMPLRGWEAYTGNRTDIVIGRGSIQTKYAGDYSRVKYQIGKDGVKNHYDKTKEVLKITDRMKRQPREIILPNGEIFFGGDALIGNILYHFMVSPISGKKRSASTGFIRVLQIILSGLCNKVDIYGMSANCGGYYHKRHLSMKIQHSCELESWVLHHIMRNYYETFHTCVFL
mmetsp:Transcript_3289/g.11183  ORF Transcript_3289/g.11183 Transcript_3289/m.11183 type:complete len:382 (-) Transcript_3289:3463-4608(-)